MKKVVITIARQYGSGGKTIGKMLGEDLGIPVFSREILKKASEESGINETLFNQVDEKLMGSPLFRIMKREYRGELLSPDSDDFLSKQNLFNYQAKVIKGLAEEGACVIIGRCGDYVLRDNPNRVAVFVHAPADYCRQMAIERGAQSTRDVDRFIAQTDKARAEYYHYYTGQEWSNAKNYDLCLNSGAIGFDGCVEAIKSYIRIRFPDYRNPAL
jgi:cytidylate kinase